MVLALRASLFQQLCFWLSTALQCVWYKVRPLRGWGQEEVGVVGKVVLITGANSGLGRYCAEAMAQRGATVILGCRNMRKGQLTVEPIMNKTGSQHLDLVELDLADLSSVRGCGALIASKYPHIDILINNAGVMMTTGERQVTVDGFELHMGTNHLGHFLLTHLLLPLLKRAGNARVVHVSSSAAYTTTLDMRDVNLARGGHNLGGVVPVCYCNSKFANALFNREFGQRVKGVNSYALCPGLVRSHLFRNVPGVLGSFANLALCLGGLSPKKASETILMCALSKELGPSSGEMFRFGGKWHSLEQLLEPQLATDFWEESAKLVGINEHTPNNY